MIIHDVEQNSDEWLAMRCTIPTASNASKLITSTGNPSKSMAGYAMELAGNKFAGKDINGWEGNIYTERGHEIEDNARSSYELINDVDVNEVGFITDDLESFGASPDGLVGEDGLLEIKCLPKNHIKTLMYFDKHGHCPPDYIAQTQMQLYVTGRKWCDLFFYHDSLPNLTLRQWADKAIFDALNEQIAQVNIERDRIFHILKGF